jgi:hypothetical protein
VRRPVLPVLTAALLFPVATLAQQTTTRFTLAWTDNSYRYEGNQRVPVGPQTATLTVISTVGDSVRASLPTANPDIIDTFDGTMTPTRLVLQSRAREAAVRRPGDDASAPPRSVSFTVRFAIDLQGDTGTGTRTMELVLPPGMSAPAPEPVTISVRRLP